MRQTVSAVLGLVLGVFQTSGGPPLPTGEVSRIAFGSCAKHWQSQPIWDAVLDEEPDLWLFLGDNIYGDTDGTTAWKISEGQLNGEWNRLADKPEWQRFRARVPVLATWDNHDYCSHAGGGEFAHKEIARKAFLTFFGEPADSPRWTQDGIYDARILGPAGKRVQIILLDTKWNRSPFKRDPTPQDERLAAGKVGGYLPDDDPAMTHLGDAQWRWLEAELKKPAEVRLLCSSTQVIPDQKGMDEWGNFPRERERLLALCREAGNMVILSGNVHFAEISERDGLVEFTLQRPDPRERDLRFCPQSLPRRRTVHGTPVRPGGDRLGTGGFDHAEGHHGRWGGSIQLSRRAWRQRRRMKKTLLVLTFLALQTAAARLHPSPGGL